MLPTAALLVCFSYANFPTFVLATSTANIGGMIVMNLSQAIFQIKRAKDIFAKFRTQVSAHNTDFTTEPFEVLRVNPTKVTVQGHEIPLLSNLTFAFEGGQKYAIVGPSGVGKTTLTMIIMGLLKTYTGSIKINDIDYEKISSESLVSLMSYCSNLNFVFDTSIANNISLFEKGADISYAARLVNIFKEFEKEAKKFNESSFSLSEGQKQRLNLARAIFENKDILIFDETFSNLDSNNTKMIMKNLKSLRSKTIIIISHNILSKDSFFDDIIELKAKKE